MSKRSRDTYDAILGKLRAFGSAYPGAHAKSPWPGHNDLAVNNKTFAYLSVEGEPFSMSVKLRGAQAAVLQANRLWSREERLGDHRTGCRTDAFPRRAQVVDR